MNEIRNFNEWMEASIKGNEKIYSAHFDQFYDHDVLFKSKGFELAKFSYNILCENCPETLIARACEMSFVFTFPISISDEILRWEEDMWKHIGFGKEPPSVYVMQSGCIFDDYSEEYRRPIDFPAEGKLPVSAIFRSFRNTIALKNHWEFSNCIYLCIPGEDAA